MKTPASKHKFLSRISLCAALLIPLFACVCRHVNPQASETQRPFDENLKDYALVYSLPEQSDRLRAQLARVFNDPDVVREFKEVVEAGAYKEANGPGKLMILGTAKTSSLVRECLRELGVELGERKATIAGRSYALAPYSFAACYESHGKKVLLSAAPSFHYLVPCLLMDTTMPAAGSYLLLNADFRIVERGGVQKSGDGLRLVPDVIHTGAASTPEERAKELAPVAAAASYVPFGPEDFRFVDRAAAGKKMIFIGEDPHHDWKIYNTVIGLSLHLRKKLGYGVLAREGCYTGWPYLEARDMGESARLPNVLPEKEFPEDYTAEEPLAAYNRSVPANLRLLCTTLDIDHEIDYAKTNTALYLGFLASRSSSIEARADIAKAIPALPGLKERQELNAYFDDLERRFRAAWSSFLPQDQDEIAFSLSLERASVQWMFRQEVQSKDMDDLRGEYFRKTIERAFAKAKRAGGALICYVGGAHAFLNAFGPGDYTVAKTTEARYFNTQYPASKGRVASILIERIGEWNEPNPGTLEAAAIALMGDKDRVFINLRDRSWTAMKNRPGTFFSAHEPKYDGVLFIK